ncbi:helix-turn-helix transcriptional regulator [Marinoscillum furvescens]|uniref:Y4mF family transcriptional regulator n=1 Tax=Marinoscillum furvescens DSM 4134 TaxID=1122208 RepID=A0A3D9LHS1_MARFU|nr:helix-turn-helix transcriptional regulator [Marinoscillum furvescens]REE05961.1 y4mF family transcriptional regulator [Marinoscillum furvescens DSM 4134]
MKTRLATFVKDKRKQAAMNQEDLSFAAGVGLRFVRDLEQGKPTLRMDKVNQVLNLFGYELGPVAQNRDEESQSSVSE